jgi:hypothetical protein
MCYGFPKMLPYKKYYNRRAAQKGQEIEETHCCPSRMPIIGPILFSLFIFSPLILPTSDPDTIPHSTPNSVIEKTWKPEDVSRQEGEIQIEKDLVISVP